MKRSFKTLAVAVTTIALTTANGSLVSACGGRSGGGSSARASFGGHSSYSSHRNYGGHYGGSSTYASSCPTSRYASPVYSQPALSHAIPSQPQPQPQPQFEQAPAPTGAPSNLAANGFSQGRPVQTASTQPVNAAAPAPAPTQSTPPRIQPVSQPTSQPQSAEASALQMLASINNVEPSPAEESQPQLPEFTAASSTTAGAHVGNWKVNLPGNQSVELNLADDGNFSWTATKDGKSNSFSGQYRLENGQLTLVRSNDLQQMTGQWTGNEGNFTFKLEGATNGGLNFQRS